MCIKILLPTKHSGHELYAILFGDHKISSNALYRINFSNSCIHEIPNPQVEYYSQNVIFSFTNNHGTFYTKI